MKQSTIHLFNISKKFQNSSLSSAFSQIKNTSTFSKNQSRNVTCLNFPKLYSKIKFSRNRQNLEYKSSYSEIGTNLETLSQIDNDNITQALNIYHYPFLNQNKMLTNKKYVLPNVLKNKFNKINESSYSPMILFQPKMNKYKRFLSEQYKVNNKDIIENLETKFKQKNDSILNIVQTKDAFLIKGKKYKKYFFPPKEKINILLFHKNIMEENLKRFEKRRKIEDLKKFENKKLLDKRRSISNDNIFLPMAFTKRRSIKLYTRNYLTKNNLKNKIENMVNTEINKVSFNYNF